MSCRAARPLHSSVLAPLRRQHPVHAARRPLLAPSRLVVRSGGAEADQLQQTARDGHLNNSGRPKPQRVGPCSNPNCGSPTTSGQWYLAPKGSSVAGVVCARCYTYSRVKGLLPLLPIQPKRPKLHGPCCNPACGATETSGVWLSAPKDSGVAGPVCHRCYNYNRLKGVLPVLPVPPKLHGPCCNPACGATETSGVWLSAPKDSGVAGPVCHRCYNYNRLKGVLPVLPVPPKLHGPCSNPACGATETSRSWCSAPEGSGVAGAVCHRCYQHNRRNGVLPVLPIQPKLTKLHGPCCNPACGATETTKSWHSAPKCSGVAGVVCSRCYQYNRRNGVLPVSANRPKQHGPCCNPACGATETSRSWYSAPEGSGVAGAVCHRCYNYNRLKGVLPVSPKRPKLHGPCSNFFCGATETSISWHSAPEGSGVAGAVCSRCYQYNRSTGVMPMFPPRVYRTKLHDS